MASFFSLVIQKCGFPTRGWVTDGGDGVVVVTGAETRDLGGVADDMKDEVLRGVETGADFVGEDGAVLSGADGPGGV